MFCGKCGNNIADNSAFCPICGSAITRIEENTQETEALTNAEFENNDSNFATPGFDETPRARKKRENKFDVKTLLKIAIPLVAVVIVVAIVASSLYGIGGFFIKTFGSDQAYFSYVASHAVESNFIDGFANNYGTSLETLDGSYGANAEIKLTVGEEARELIGDLVPVDVEWAKEANVKIETNVKDSKMEYTADVKLNGSELADLRAILDMEEGELFLAVLNLNKKYLSAEGSQFNDESMEMLAKISKELPSDAKINKLLKKYVKIALKEIDEVSAEKETLKVNGISQKVTAIEIELSEETFVNMGTAVLEELIEDKDVKKIIKDMGNTMEEEDMLDMDGEELYESFVEALEDTLENMDYDASSETLCTVTFYVDGSHDVTGFKVSVEDQDLLVWESAQKGSKIATEIYVNVDGTRVGISGEGTKAFGKINGTYDVEAMGVTITTIDVKGFDTDKLKDGYLKGTFTIDASAVAQLANTAANGEMPSSVMSELDDVQLELKFDSAAKKANIEMNVLKDGEVFVGIEMKSNLKYNGKNVSIPSESKCYDQEDADEWLGEIDWDKLIKALEKAEVDSDIIELIEEAIDEIA